jgi:energy-coupling factor transporter ATP-binding protein EcfA2
MGSARQDYERFIRWLHAPQRQAPEDARRFANLVLANFDSVAGTSRQRNHRSTHLVALARNHLAATPPDIPELAEATPEGEWPWRRLRHLTLGPFRGFRAAQLFDFRKRLVLCYGPNGSGKSSLCEALEYALLGQVEEADTKRMEPQQYLANIHARRFVPPMLKASDANDREVDVEANPNLFRFCFVEKNRIDAFSRIAARPPGRRAELIATLFGMDQFNDFVSHFNESMDQALTLGNMLQVTLANRRQALTVDRATAEGETSQLERLDQNAAQYAEAFTAGCTYADLKALVSSSEPPCRLQQLESQLNVVPPALIGVSRQRLAKLYSEADGAAQRAQISTRLLEDRRSQVSFQDLYNAVLVLRADDPDHCPACRTPIAEVAESPFARAEVGLGELKELAALQADDLRLRGELDDASRTLREELRKLHDFLGAQGEGNGLVITYIAALPGRVETHDWWIGVLSPEADETGATPTLEQVFAAADMASQQDQRSAAALRERQAIIEERDRLNEVRLWIQQQEIRRQRVIEDATAARARIEQFEAANSDLNSRAIGEVEANARDRPINAAYDRFMPLMRLFRDELPGMLVADLNQVALELYNEFNQTDHDADKLADLNLPLTGDEHIKVAFRGEPNRRVDALAVLSEGHIRCLGLAILLAKAINVRAPVIIFDDAINAIDHDHRSGIRSAIFESDRFRQTQIIVTCHSPEFIKDVQNHIPRELRADCQEYLLLHHVGDHQPRVNPDVGSSNYLAKANEAMARLDSRDALSHCRKALEMLTRKSWKWLESHRVGDLSVQIEGPGKEPQLRILCEALRRKLLDLPMFAHPSKQPLVDGLNMILGIPSGNLVWTYLNKGTHEEADRDDFDRDQVATVIRALESIDAQELRPNR